MNFYRLSLLLEEEQDTLVEWSKERRRTVIGGVVGLLLSLATYTTWWAYAHTPPLGCASLPEHGPSGEIAIAAARMADRRGSVCVRVYNGTEQDLEYAPSAWSLQESWAWVIWYRYFNLADFLWGDTIATVMPMWFLRAGGKTGAFLPHSGRRPAPPGRYRACFRYNMEGSHEERRVCSAPFWLP